MIKDMIVKLMEEATEEAEHKGFCDTELSTNKQTRDSKSTSVDELMASLEELQATSKLLMSEVSGLSEEVKNIDAAVASATSVRNEEKAKNKATMEDATVAKLAVEKAMRVLSQFYDKASKATALVQAKTKQPVPETFDKPFTGMGGEGGILGMLEVILSDFERLARETEETETVSQKDYEAFMADSQQDKAVKNADIQHKQSKNVKINSDIASTRRDLKSTQEELSAAMSYYEKLKPSCVDAGESYEERVQRRKDEIQSLEESLKILTGEDIA
jgi:chromosome segregation ATPase